MRDTGIEPVFLAWPRTKIYLLMRARRIELRLVAWEATVLPLNYARKFNTGFSKNIFVSLIIFWKKLIFCH